MPLLQCLTEFSPKGVVGVNMRCQSPRDVCPACVEESANPSQLAMATPIEKKHIITDAVWENVWYHTYTRSCVMTIEADLTWYSIIRKDTMHWYFSVGRQSVFERCRLGKLFCHRNIENWTWYWLLEFNLFTGWIPLDMQTVTCNVRSWHGLSIRCCRSQRAKIADSFVQAWPTLRHSFPLRKIFSPLLPSTLKVKMPPSSATASRLAVAFCFSFPRPLLRFLRAAVAS